MDKKEYEELKKRLENAEFNNPDEDERENKEGNKKGKEATSNDFFDDKDKKKNIIIVSLVAIVIILLIIVFIFLLSSKGNDNNNSTNNNNDNSSTENKSSDDKGQAKKIVEEDYNYSSGKIYFNKYVYLQSKNEEKATISDLEGNILIEISNSYIVYEGKDKDIYLVDSNYKNDGNFNIKRIKDSTISDVFKENATGLIFGKEKNNLLGIYKEDNDNDIIYLIDGNNYNTIELDSHASYLYGKKEHDDKYIYNGKYIITYDNKNYGLYDIKDKKQLIKESYEYINYLHDDIFAAVKNEDSGVINSNNKTLLDFKYDLVVYSNGLYFTGDNNKLSISDSNFKSLNKEIDVPSLSNFSYNPCCGKINPFDLTEFKNIIIARIGTSATEVSNYIMIDKKGNTTPLGKGYVGFVGDSFIKTSTDDNYIMMYDGSGNVTHKIDAGEKAINLNNVTQFLSNILVINRNKLYDLNKNTTKGSTSWYRRTSNEFEVKIDFKGENGTVTVSSNDVVLKTLENVSVDEFLKANNNGITVTKDYFIYNAGGVIIIKRVEENKKD